MENITSLDMGNIAGNKKPKNLKLHSSGETNRIKCNVYFISDG